MLKRPGMCKRYEKFFLRKVVHIVQTLWKNGYSIAVMPAVLCVFLAAAVGVAYGQCPNVPINYLGQPADVEKAVGIWYEYRHMDYPYGPYNAADDPSVYNLIQNATIIGAFPAAGRDRGPRSYYITWMYNGIDVGVSGSSPAECVAIWQQGNLTSEGKRQVVVQFDTAAGSNAIMNFTYTNLFTDYNLVQVLYRCNTPNADGKKCDEPFVWVHTRIRPPELKDSQKKYIESVANQYMAPVVCGKFKLADMAPSKWDLSKTGPPCNVADNQPPMSQEFKNLFPKTK